MTTITTPRLVLRRYTHTDIPDILAFIAHPSVSRATPEIKATEADVKHYIDQQNACQPFEIDRCLDLAIELKEEKRVIGLVSAVRREHEQAEIGWALGVQYRGRGLATEAAEALVAYGFDVLRLHRISACTGKHNTRSWRLMERIGMRREAHLRESHQVDGEWDDEFIYAILADEWKQSKVESDDPARPSNRLWSGRPPGHGNQIATLGRFKGGAVVTAIKRDLVKARRRKSSRQVVAKDRT